MSQGYTATYDRTAKTMYATDGDQWFSYDNPYTMSIKAQYVTDNSLGGVMVRPQQEWRRGGLGCSRSTKEAYVSVC